MLRKKKVLYVLLALVCMAAVAFGVNKGIGNGLTDGKYDNSYALVDWAGTDLSGLGERVRSAEVTAYDQDNNLVFNRTTLAYIHDENYVIVPVALFHVATAQGVINILNVPEITTRIALLPNVAYGEDVWRKEELGKVEYISEIGYLSGFAVVERTNPMLGPVGASQYTFGKYADLKAGDVLYRVGQINGRSIVYHTAVNELLNISQMNLIHFQASDFLFPDLGGLLFALRDGKPELVGFVCVVEPISGVSSQAVIHGLDINQIIAAAAN